MAISNLPSIWSARTLAAYQRQSVWRGLVYDLSSEVRGPGETIKLTQLTTTPSIVDYVQGTAMSAPALLVDANIDLPIDKQKAFNFAVEDVERRQTASNVVETHVARTGQALALQVDSDLRAAYQASLATANVVTSIAQDGRDDATETAAHLTWQKAMAHGFNLAAQSADSAGWPRERRWSVVHPLVARAMRSYLVNLGYSIADLQSDALQRASIDGLYGWALSVDPGIITGAGDDDRYQVHCGVTSGIESTLFHAEQIRQMEVLRQVGRFADFWQGLLTYGSVAPINLRRLVIRQTT